MVFACERLEAAHGLSRGRLRFEVQVETPELILAADGTAPVATLLHRSAGRVTGLHYGTYDYSASLGIAAGFQSMEHPAADYAKQVMQVAVAGTGVRLSDGSSNVIPIGDPAGGPRRMAAARPTRPALAGARLLPGLGSARDAIAEPFHRHVRVLPRGAPAGARACAALLYRAEGGFMDEPATARALAGFVSRAVACGAVDAG